MNDKLSWALALVFGISAVLCGWSVAEGVASIRELSAMVGALVWLLATWRQRYAVEVVCVSTPRALQTIEFPFVHGGKRQ